ncbi:MAG TPA: helix-turn-helix domain-containing protein [Pseudogracilibacillus sp.]|nr:helix-turn-helix domain-containing protein [Pseudogracilibacillus sp.]
MKPIKIEPIRRTTLTTVEVAEYLGVSKETVYNLVREKAIVHFRIGSKILFKRDAIDNWMDLKMVSGLDEDE